MLKRTTSPGVTGANESTLVCRKRRFCGATTEPHLAQRIGTAQTKYKGGVTWLCRDTLGKLVKRQLSLRFGVAHFCKSSRIACHTNRPWPAAGPLDFAICQTTLGRVDCRQPKHWLFRGQSLWATRPSNTTFDARYVRLDRRRGGLKCSKCQLDFETFSHRRRLHSIASAPYP